MDKQIIFHNNYHDKILLNDKLKDKISNISICQFITIKKGRKFKSFDGELKNINNYNVKRVHNKFSNDNVRRRIKALFNDYIIKLLN